MVYTCVIMCYKFVRMCVCTYVVISYCVYVYSLCICVLWTGICYPEYYVYSILYIFMKYISVYIMNFMCVVFVRLYNVHMPMWYNFVCTLKYCVYYVYVYVIYLYMYSDDYIPCDYVHIFCCTSVCVQNVRHLRICMNDVYVVHPYVFILYICILRIYMYKCMYTMCYLGVYESFTFLEISWLFCLKLDSKLC